MYWSNCSLTRQTTSTISDIVVIACLCLSNMTIEILWLGSCLRTLISIVVYCSQLQFVNCFYSFNEWMNELFNRAILYRWYACGSVTWLCGVRLTPRVRAVRWRTASQCKSVVVSTSVSVPLPRPLHSSPRRTKLSSDLSAMNLVTHLASERSTALVSTFEGRLDLHSWSH